MAPKSLRVFIDSNVLLSGLFADKGAPRLFLDILSLRLPALTALTGVYNLAEVERNLAAKLPAAFPVFRSSLEKMGIEIMPLPKRSDLKRWSGFTAEKDAPVLASAFLGKADVLVTGDKRHLLKIKNPDLPFIILSPAEFLNEFLPRFLKT